MLIIGYRGNVDWTKVKDAFKRCTSMTTTEISEVVSRIKKGQSITVAYDFVLHDELRDLGLLLR